MINTSKRHIINDPYLNEFVFDCMQNSTVQQRKHLTGVLLKACKDKNTAKNFADRASFEMKVIMLARLGIKFGMYFSKPENFTAKAIKSVYSKYKVGSRLDEVNKMLDSRTFVVTDKDVHLCLGMLAQNCHSETYMMNRDYIKAGYTATQWENAELANSSMINSSVEAAKLVCKLILNGSLTLQYGSSITGAHELSMQILMYLFPFKSQYVTFHNLHNNFKGTHKLSPIRLAIRELTELMYIQKLPHEKAYTITGLGITSLLTFLDRVIRSSL